MVEQFTSRRQFDGEQRECPRCGREMDHADAGTRKALPFAGLEVEFVRFSCSECGQGVVFERAETDEKWTRTDS